MTNTKGIFHSILFFFFGCTSRLALDAAYLFVLAPLYSYMGFVLEVSFVAYSVSWIIYAVGLILSPRYFYKMSDLVLTIGIVSILGPLTTFVGLGGYEAIVAVGVLAALAGLYYLAKSRLLFTLNLPPVRHGETMAILISVAGVLAVLVFLISSGALRYFSLDLEGVYDVRDSITELTHVGLMAYLNTWAFRTFMIFLLCWTLLRRQYLWMVAVLVLQVIFFGLTAHKSVFFSPLAVFAIWIMLRRSNSLLFLPVGLTVLVSGCIALYYMGELNPISFFVRRILFVPALLHFHYFEFFSENPFIMWSHLPGISSLISHPYGGLSAASVVGTAKFNGAHANIGFIGSGFAHAGVMGIVIYMFFVAALLKMLDGLMKKQEEVWYFVALTVFQVDFIISTVDPLTALLTHGLLPMFILLFISQNREVLRN